jgi:hypothetical protein
VRGRRLWLKVEAHGGTIPVYVTKGPILDDDGVTELDAFYEKDSPCIVIKSSDNVAAMKQRLHHELLHVCFGAHSGDAREKVLGARTPEGRAKREEDIVSFLEPVQFDMLVRNKWLRYPNPPRLT